ncbi:MAG TPA: low affinity iron permease family protein [Thermomicrobiales bacterium]|jgi:low affinity Fe/Cu permease
MAKIFAKFSNRIAHWTGHYVAFIVALLIIVVWAITGPLFGFSDTWQLVINTGTTIVTFLMVFLIQNTQNRDALAVHLKLDELLRAIGEADNALMEVEDDTDEDLEQLKTKYLALVDEHKELKVNFERLSAGTAQRNGRETAQSPR